MRRSLTKYAVSSVPLNSTAVVFTLMSSMTSAAPPSTCGPFEKRDDGNGGTILARHDGSLKQSEWRDPTIELSTSAIYEPKASESRCDHDSNHNDDLEPVGCNISESNRKTHVDQSQNAKASHSLLGSDYLEAWVGRQHGRTSTCVDLLRAGLRRLR
jgi:hypothetical protein